MSRAGEHSGPPIARTPSGSVRGVWEYASPGAAPNADAVGTDVAVFRGIPYAEPPTGEHRYAAPRPRRPWEGVFEATRFGPTPMRGHVGMTLIPEESIAGDDILSVNVWTPTLDPDAALPVLVWIHGGGYLSGSPASPWYDGRAFARDGVVLVTLSYRLGFRGFGWIEGAVPNRGVLDWVCALQWVQGHIASFGGDPGRVTIGGQSAGGSAALTLMGVPCAAGLFHGVCAMSPAIADASLIAAKDRGRRLAKLAAVAPDEAGFLSIPESRVLELQRRVASPAMPHLLHDLHELLREGLMIGPVADGEVVLSDVETAASRGSSAGVPLVIGTADDELTGLLQPGGPLEHLPRRMLLRALGASSQSAAHWLEHPRTGAFTSTAVMLGRYVTDVFFRSWVPRIAATREQSPEAGPTWSYRFSWHGEKPPYAGHCIDIPFVFDRLDAPGVSAVAGPAPPQRLAGAVHGAIVRFSRDGYPGWPRDTDGDGPSRIFDVPLRDEADAYASARMVRPEEAAVAVAEPPVPEVGAAAEQPKLRAQ